MQETLLLFSSDYVSSLYLPILSRWPQPWPLHPPAVHGNSAVLIPLGQIRLNSGAALMCRKLSSFLVLIQASRSILLRHSPYWGARKAFKTQQPQWPIMTLQCSTVDQSQPCEVNCFVIMWSSVSRFGVLVLSIDLLQTLMCSWAKLSESSRCCCLCTWVEWTMAVWMSAACLCLNHWLHVAAFMTIG